MNDYSDFDHEAERQTINQEAEWEAEAEAARMLWCDLPTAANDPEAFDPVVIKVAGEDVFVTHLGDMHVEAQVISTGDGRIHTLDMTEDDWVTQVYARLERVVRAATVDY